MAFTIKFFIQTSTSNVASLCVNCMIRNVLLTTVLVTKKNIYTIFYYANQMIALATGAGRNSLIVMAL